MASLASFAFIISPDFVSIFTVDLFTVLSNIGYNEYVNSFLFDESKPLSYSHLIYDRLSSFSKIKRFSSN